MVRKRIYKGHSLVKDIDNYTVVDIETTSLELKIFNFLSKNY